MTDNNDDIVIDELEAEPIEAPNPIADFLNSVEGQDFVNAERQFGDMINDRLQNAMDQAKIKIASSLYSDELDDDGGDEEEVELDAEELEDEIEVGDEIEVDDEDDLVAPV